MFHVEPMHVRIDSLCNFALGFVDMNSTTARGYATVAAIFVLSGVVGNCDVAEEYRIEAQEKVLRPARVMSMPRPAFEEPHRLLRLTPPVECVRLPGIEGMGREWIRSWGDGELPPAIPTCANARHGTDKEV